ncbi:hypothetical protein [Sphingobium tyrosinilyticum]|uniref:Transposase n=1 Tax=Sphingobium tyrosinilyticum TaxID=2715436 RepID=A0ABV9F0S4_9SPHN
MFAEVFSDDPGPSRTAGETYRFDRSSAYHDADMLALFVAGLWVVTKAKAARRRVLAPHLASDKATP